MLSDTLGRSGADPMSWWPTPTSWSRPGTLFRLDFDAHAEQTWSGLILDEAQYVKNRQAKTHQCARKLSTPFKLAITGTPMENNLMELWSLLAITAPGLFPDATRFADFYAKPIEKLGEAELLELFRRRIKPLVKRRTKDPSLPSCPPSRTRFWMWNSRRGTASFTKPVCSVSARRCWACSTMCSATGSPSSSR